MKPWQKALIVIASIFFGGICPGLTLLANAQPATIILGSTAYQGAATTITFTVTITSGEILSVAVGDYSTGNGSITVSDSAGNTWTQESGVGASDGFVSYKLAVVIDAPVTSSSGSDTISVSLPGTNNRSQTTVYELNSEYNPTNAKSAGESNSLTFASVAPITISAPSAVIVASTCGNAGGGEYYTQNGFVGYYGGYAATGYSAGITGTGLTLPLYFYTYLATPGSCSQGSEVAVFYPEISGATTTTTTTVTSTTTLSTATVTTTSFVINNQGALAAVILGAIVVCFTLIAVAISRRK